MRPAEERPRGGTGAAMETAAADEAAADTAAAADHTRPADTRYHIRFDELLNTFNIIFDSN